MRPAQPGEVPAFGSVWQWSSVGSARYLALGLRPGAGSVVDLLAVRIDIFESKFSDSMAWGNVIDGRVMPAGTVNSVSPDWVWLCVAEAP